MRKTGYSGILKRIKETGRETAFDEENKKRQKYYTDIAGRHIRNCWENYMTGEIKETSLYFSENFLPLIKNEIQCVISEDKSYLQIKSYPKVWGEEKELISKYCLDRKKNSSEVKRFLKRKLEIHLDILRN